MKTRRDFFKKAAATGAALAFAPIASAAPAVSPGNKFCFFTKHLQGLSFTEIADHASKLGVDGIEAPVRVKGHVEPERVEEDLPKLVAALKANGLEMTILTSGINAVSAEQHTEKVLRTAKALGVERYRMGYWKYDLSKPVWPQLEEIRASVQDLIVLSREIGIQPLLQNHSGRDYVAAPIWDGAWLMHDFTPQDWSFAFDILHASLEGGKSWPIQYNLIRERIGAAYFKDFRWVGTKSEVVPLGEGVAAGKEYAKLLKNSGYKGPVSLHMEYLKEGLDSKAAVEEAFTATTRDLALLKGWWA